MKSVTVSHQTVVVTTTCDVHPRLANKSPDGETWDSSQARMCSPDRSEIGECGLDYTEPSQLPSESCSNDTLAKELEKLFVLFLRWNADFPISSVMQ